MIERTKTRLEEVRSLLRKLQEVKLTQLQQAAPTAPPEFHSLLNAFVVAARSVRWVLKSEEKQKYAAWSPSWDAALSEDENIIFRLVTGMRNSIEKQGHPGIVARREFPRYIGPAPGHRCFTSTRRRSAGADLSISETPQKQRSSHLADVRIDYAVMTA